MKKIDNAREFLSLGIAVIPLRHRGKEPESAMMGGAWEQYKDHLPTEYDLLRWFGSNWQNYGVVCGWGGLAVIDFDNADQYAVWLDYYDKYLVRIYELDCPPYTVQSARGAHVYIRLFGDYQNQRRQGIDVKVHGYVVGAGCVHPTGTEYREIHPKKHFPQVFDLDTWLPVELFPKIAPEASMGHLEPLPMPFDNLSKATYDPFAQATRVNADVDLLQLVKSSVRIEHLFPQATKTSADGRWLACVCPFHDDKKPSAWIDTRRQLFGCQVCGFRPMDAVNLYARMHNMSDRDAVSAMAKAAGVWG
jgi:hypothetical protein